MILCEFFDLCFLIFWYVGDNQVLVSGDVEFVLMDFSNFQQVSFQWMIWIIENVVVFNKQCQVLFIINFFYLVDVIVVVGKFVWVDWFKFNVCLVFYFCFEGFDIDVFKGVFGFCIFMVGMVVLVVLGGYNCFCYCQCMFQWQIIEFVCCVGVGFFVIMFDREIVVYQQVKVYQFVIFGNCYEVYVVSVQIDIVLWWDYYCGFKFMWQIGLVEDWFFVGSGDFFLIQLDFGISVGMWQQMFRDFFCLFVGFSVQL